MNETRDRKRNIEIRNYREGDEGQLNDLYKLIFIPGRSMAGWYWKFNENPLADYHLISVAETRDGKLVGMYPLLVMEFKVKEEFVRVVQTVEISVHPEFRGPITIRRLKNLSKQLALEKGAKFGFGLPTQVHARVGRRLMNYNFLGVFPILCLKIVGQFPIKRRKLQRIFEILVSPFSRIYHSYCFSSWAKEEKRKSGSIEIVELDGFDSDFDRLWEEISREYPVVNHRSSSYLRWRYSKNPMADFTIIGAKRDGHLTGYLIYTTHVVDGEQSGIIFDFFCGEGNPDGKLLLREGLLMILKERVKAIRCGALTHTSIYRYLEELGFRTLSTSPLINFEVLDDDLDAEAMGDLNLWYLSYGDTDLLGW